MIKKIPVLFFIIFSLQGFSQSLKITGNTKDTTSNQTLPNALLMTIRFSDSTLIDFSRTNKEGVFKPLTIPLDTYIVIISHPKFSDKTFLLVPNKNDTAFRFRNIILPPKSFQLNEVEIIAYKDKMFYKGDTLMFTADSFKMRQNATVEDLLRKLPGIKVDVNGKITIQGKEVDQVLVDGDEFFGSDPTIATRNLNANTVETVQVYEQKNESTESGGDETVKVVNLKLKEDAKKGYFGKISGATDAQKFYENDILLNRFKKDLKISVFGLHANTPKQSFGWKDANNFGINESNGFYDPESNTWTGFDEGSTGIPQTLKSGFYYNDKFGKNTKVSSDYTFKENRLNSSSETNTQFFLTDTSYSNRQITGRTSQDQSHNFNFRLTQKLDSLTELIIRPKINYSIQNSSGFQEDLFLSQEGDSTRKTRIASKSSSETTDAGAQIKLTRNFMKKNRLLLVNYNPTYYNLNSNSDLETDFLYFKGQLPDSLLLQKRAQLNNRQEHSGSIGFTEPFTKKFKAALDYGFSYNLNNNNRTTLDFNGEAYDIINPAQSNNFRNTRVAHRVGGRAIYEVKKYRLMFGANYKNIFQENINVTLNQKLNQTFIFLLPFANINFRFSQSSNLSLNYYNRADPPDLKQMQPVADNTDPNRISIGNPELKPGLTHNFSLNYWTWKGLSETNFYTGINYNLVQNDINEKTSFDSLGRSVTSPVNINGNHYGNFWAGGGFPLFKRFMKVDLSINGDYSNKNTFVNDQSNNTQSYGLRPNIELEKELKWMEIGINGGYSYNQSRQSISYLSNQPYYSYNLGGNLLLRLPKKFRITSDGNYVNNGNRTPGYNINYFILNAAVSKSFFKGNELTVSLEGYDILNQNIDNQRFTSANKITDKKTQIIKRYFLLRLVYRFTSQKSKAEEEEDEDD